MGKLSLTLIISAVIAISPALVQAQSFRANGFRGSSGFGAKGFRGGSTVPAFKGVYGARGSMSSAPRSLGFRNASNNKGFIGERGFGHRRLSSGFSNTTRSNFSNNSNLTPSTLNTPISAHSQNFINTRGNLAKSANISTRSFNHRSFNTNNSSSSGSLTGETVTKGKHNTAFIPLRSKTSSTFRESKINNKPASSIKTVSTSRGVNLKSFSTVNRIKNISPGSITNAEMVKGEINRSPSKLSNSSAVRTEISHWVDKETGVRHFSNNVTSFRKGRETIVFVNGKKVDSKSADLNSNKTNTTVSRSSKTSLSAPNIAALKPAVRQTNNSLNSSRGLIIEDSSAEPTTFHGKRHDGHFHHHFHHDHFFVSPFFTFSQSTFLFAFNPFVFRALVLSPFFTFSTLPNFFFVTSPFIPLIPSPLFDPFVFRPVFFSPFFNSFPFGSVFFFNNSLINNPAFVFSESTLIR
jgi:hypothetical protein